MRAILLFTVFCAFFLPACSGGSEKDTLDTGQPAAVSQESAQVEIVLGMPAARVAKLLGTADNVDNDHQGREIWNYFGKRAQYVYVSNKSNIQALVIGGYVADVSQDKPAPGLPLNLRFVFDGSRKVSDFVFNQMGL